MYSVRLTFWDRVSHGNTRCVQKDFSAFNVKSQEAKSA